MIPCDEEGVSGDLYFNMPINTHILRSSKKLKEFEEKIERITKNIESAIYKIFPVGDIDIIFYENPSATLKDSGIGGYTPCANTIFFSMDPDNPSFQEKLERELSFQLAHEINHAIRFRTPIDRETLFEAVISEGLADHFAMEINNTKIPPYWTTYISDEQKELTLKKAFAEWDSTDYNHSLWFYGSDEKIIPRWTGYRLGFDIVHDYLKNHLDMKPSGLISVNSEIFRKYI